MQHFLMAQKVNAISTRTGECANVWQAIAAVLSNWHNVLRAISMASAKIPVPKEADVTAGPDLPQTLVRIPIQQAEQAQAHAEENNQ